MRFAPVLSKLSVTHTVGLVSTLQFAEGTQQVLDPMSMGLNQTLSFTETFGLQVHIIPGSNNLFLQSVFSLEGSDITPWYGPTQELTLGQTIDVLLQYGSRNLSNELTLRGTYIACIDNAANKRQYAPKQSS